ncbi:hypothetical protein V8F33_005755 [Rhypophila sp. PSN 637]
MVKIWACTNVPVSQTMAAIFVVAFTVPEVLRAITTFKRESPLPVLLARLRRWGEGAKFRLAWEENALGLAVVGQVLLWVWIISRACFYLGLMGLPDLFHVGSDKASLMEGYPIEGKLVLSMPAIMVGLENYYGDSISECRKLFRSAFISMAQAHWTPLARTSKIRFWTALSFGMLPTDQFFDHMFTSKTIVVWFMSLAITINDTPIIFVLSRSVPIRSTLQGVEIGPRAVLTCSRRWC